MTSTNKNSLHQFIIVCAISGALLGGVLFFLKDKISRAENRNSSPQATPTENLSLASPQKTPVVKSEPMVAQSTESTHPSLKTIISEDPAVEKLAEGEKEKMNTFDEIIRSRNDNDPRLDHDLVNLSPVFHHVLSNFYETMDLEMRSERGLIAFVMARDLKSETDAQFLKKIFDESPCLSLENCRERTSSDPHLSGIDQTTLNYPQLATLYQLENKISKDPALLDNPQFMDQLRMIIAAAIKFPVPAVHQKAESLKDLYRL